MVFFVLLLFLNDKLFILNTRTRDVCIDCVILWTSNNVTWPIVRVKEHFVDHKPTQTTTERINMNNLNSKNKYKK